MMMSPPPPRRKSEAALPSPEPADTPSPPSVPVLLDHILDSGRRRSTNEPEAPAPFRLDNDGNVVLEPGRNSIFRPDARPLGISRLFTKLRGWLHSTTTATDGGEPQTIRERAVLKMATPPTMPLGQNTEPLDENDYRQHRWTLRWEAQVHEYLHRKQVAAGLEPSEFIVPPLLLSDELPCGFQLRFNDVWLGFEGPFILSAEIRTFGDVGGDFVCANLADLIGVRCRASGFLSSEAEATRIEACAAQANHDTSGQPAAVAAGGGGGDGAADNRPFSCIPRGAWRRLASHLTSSAAKLNEWGIMHLDLSPFNVCVAWRAGAAAGEKGTFQLYIIDFQMAMDIASISIAICGITAASLRQVWQFSPPPFASPLFIHTLGRLSSQAVDLFFETTTRDTGPPFCIPRLKVSREQIRALLTSDVEQAAILALFLLTSGLPSMAEDVKKMGHPNGDGWFARNLTRHNQGELLIIKDVFIQAIVTRDQSMAFEGETEAAAAVRINGARQRGEAAKMAFRKLRCSHVLSHDGLAASFEYMTPSTRFHQVVELLECRSEDAETDNDRRDLQQALYLWKRFCNPDVQLL
ncbi:unnamed protein product [Vitrella brassicaformis CCMP3155]|uniref:Uncharacterized protein n=2 Tax=Vitrella brassicaformis TaxID=1169539 RepID=A0A0G4EFZ4_VITBC|nr:unnamed protein product [Vitrella brassicaformis CCMP3155]|eukprot:CEL94300.1 unnamed protein product [Vitrella brassicaformis CCMP3155]